jgi:hypothetical protein
MEKTLSEGRVQAGDLPALAGVDALESPAMVEVGWREPERRRKSVEVGGDEAQLLYLRYSVVGECQCTHHLSQLVSDYHPPVPEFTCLMSRYTYLLLLVNH